MLEIAGELVWVDRDEVVEVDLPPVHLTLVKGGRDLAIGWSLTSTSVDGRQDGQVVYSVEPVPIKLMDE